MDGPGASEDHVAGAVVAGRARRADHELGQLVAGHVAGRRDRGPGQAAVGTVELLIAGGVCGCEIDVCTQATEHDVYGARFALVRVCVTRRPYRDLGQPVAVQVGPPGDRATELVTRCRAGDPEALLGRESGQVHVAGTPAE